MTRSIPTPGDLTRGSRQAAAATAAATAAAAAYDRDAWQMAVFTSDLSTPAKLVALLLAHHAGTRGYLRAGGPQSEGRIAREAGVSARQARLALERLEADGYLRRPDVRTWKPRQIRPAALTVPAAARARTEPPHTDRRHP